MGVHMETRDLQTQIHDLTERLIQTEKNRDEYKTKYFQFKGIFQRQTHTFYLYQSLSESSKEALKGIFKGMSFEEFLACGVQPGNIDGQQNRPAHSGANHLLFRPAVQRHQRLACHRLSCGIRGGFF